MTLSVAPSFFYFHFLLSFYLSLSGLHCVILLSGPTAPHQSHAAHEDSQPVTIISKLLFSLSQSHNSVEQSTLLLPQSLPSLSTTVLLDLLLWEQAQMIPACSFNQDPLSDKCLCI